MRYTLKYTSGRELKHNNIKHAAMVDYNTAEAAVAGQNVIMVLVGEEGCFEFHERRKNRRRRASNSRGVVVLV